MKANWPSSSDPSLLDSSPDDMSVLIDFDELMDVGLDVDSLSLEDVLVFCVVRAKDFPFWFPHHDEVPVHKPLRFQLVLQWT